MRLEFLQAVEEVFDSLVPVFDKYPKYIEENLLERLVEPERIVSFRVPWVDDKGQVQVNQWFPCTILISYWSLTKVVISFPPISKPINHQIPWFRTNL